MSMDPALQETIKAKKDKPLIRKCKQCGATMGKPLEVGELLYLFCSANCRAIWNQERGYRAKAAKRRSWDD